MKIDVLSAHISDSLSEYDEEYDYETVFNMLEHDPDAIYDILIDFAREKDNPVRFYALSELVVEYEQETLPQSGRKKRRSHKN